MAAQVARGNGVKMVCEMLEAWNHTNVPIPIQVITRSKNEDKKMTCDRFLGIICNGLQGENANHRRFASC
jgi:hypothetical protein